MSLADELLADLEEEGNDDLVEALKEEENNVQEDVIFTDIPIEAMEIDVSVSIFFLFSL